MEGDRQGFKGKNSQESCVDCPCICNCECFIPSEEHCKTLNYPKDCYYGRSTLEDYRGRERT